MDSKQYGLLHQAWPENELYQDLVENYPQGILALDMAGLVKYANPEALQLLGLQFAEVSQGMNFEQIWQPDFATSVQALLTIAHNGGSGELNLQSIHSTNQQSWQHVRVSPVQNAQGQRDHLLVIVQKLAEPRESKENFTDNERRLHVLFAQAAVGIAEINAFTGQYMLVNPQLCAITGYTEAEILEQQFYGQFYHPDDQPHNLKLLTQLYHGEIAQYTTELRLIRKNGAILWVKLSVSPLWLPGETPSAHVEIIEDVSKQRETEVALHSALQEKELLLKEIHHRVKNNLQVIASLCELQPSTLVAGQIYTPLQDIQDRIRAIAGVHEQLYESVGLDVVDMQMYVETLIADLYSTYARLPIEMVIQMQQITLYIEQAIPCGLIINELVSNALKYAFAPAPFTAPGHFRAITVSLTSADKEMCLSVTDNGADLPPDFSLEGRASFGLKLVAMLTRQLRGNLALKQPPGRGKTFEVNFTRLPERKRRNE